MIFHVKQSLKSFSFHSWLFFCSFIDLPPATMNPLNKGSIPLVPHQIQYLTMIYFVIFSSVKSWCYSDITQTIAEKYWHNFSAYFVIKIVYINLYFSIWFFEKDNKYVFKARILIILNTYLSFFRNISYDYLFLYIEILKTRI